MCFGFFESAWIKFSFMSGLFDLNELRQRLRTLVQRSNTLKPEAAALLEEALMRGEFERGEVARITGLPETYRASHSR